MMATENLTVTGTQPKSFEELICSPSLADGLKKHASYLSTVNFLLSLTAFLGNSLILVALHKESSLHPPSKLLYRCLATTDLLIGLATQPLYTIHCISLVREDWVLCRFAFDTAFILGYQLGIVSLLTLTAIGVDRLLALLLGLRYRQTVTLKRMFIIVATFWVVSGVGASLFILDYRLTFWYSCAVIISCLIISFASYTKIFYSLYHRRIQTQDRVQQQPRAPNALNIARYKKAVYNALWVQLALVICYVPYIVVAILITSSETYPSQLIVSSRIVLVFVYFNSSLSPFLYCWKISEVRQAVIETIRQALCCPCS